MSSVVFIWSMRYYTCSFDKQVITCHSYAIICVICVIKGLINRLHFACVELVLLSCLRKRYAFFTKEIEKGKLACKIQTTCRCHELVIAILGRQDPYPLQQHVDICNPSDMYHVFFSTIFCVQLVLGGSLLVTRWIIIRVSRLKARAMHSLLADLSLSLTLTVVGIASTTVNQ